MLRDALTYPLRGPDTAAVFLPGLVLSFLTAVAVELPLPLALAALVPATVLVGYLGDVYLASVDGEDAPPAFGRLRPVATRGGALAALAAGYLSPAALALAVTAAGAGSVPVDTLSAVDSLRVLAGTTALFVLVVSALYLVPAAAGCALTGGGVRAGLALREVAARATDGAYFIAFWVGVVMVGSAAAVGSALVGAFGRAGAATAIVLTFYALVAATHLVGRGFGTEGPLYDLL